MKTIRIKAVLIFLIIIISVTVRSQEAVQASGKITAAIKAGNSKDLSVYFNSNIELTVLDNDGTYSKSQAEIIMKDFFSKNPPQDFTINHNGSSKDMSQYYIGSYKTKQQTFRIYFLMKPGDEKMLIQQLQIEE